MTKTLQFKLRDAIVTLVSSNKGVIYYAYVRGVRVSLTQSQYLAARVQAGLPKEITWGRQ